MKRDAMRFSWRKEEGGGCGGIERESHCFKKEAAKFFEVCRFGSNWVYFGLNEVFKRNNLVVYSIVFGGGMYQWARDAHAINVMIHEDFGQVTKNGNKKERKFSEDTFLKKPLF